MKFDFDPNRFLFPMGAASGAFLALIVLRSIVYKWLEIGAKKTKTDFDDSAVAILKTPSVFWCLAIAMHIGVHFSELEGPKAKPYYQSINVILILSASIVLANLAVLILRNLHQHAHKTTPISGLAVGILKGFVMILGGLVVLSVLGISITPVLGALGVGGLAVALALKDTLENLFAGLYLIWDQSIRVGDYVRLDAGTEGEVEDVGWRTVKVRTSMNSTVIVPNSKVAQAALTNYCLPEKRVVTTLTVYVDPASDLDVIESIMLNEARKASEDIVGVLAVPEPNTRLGQQVVDGSVPVNLNFQVADFSEQGFALHELRKRIYRRLRQQGVKLYLKT